MDFQHQRFTFFSQLEALLEHSDLRDGNINLRQIQHAPALSRVSAIPPYLL